MISIHSNSSIIKVSAIKAFTDNYIWAITNSNRLALVDPGDANVCIDFIEQHQLTLSAILITHHHPDHTGGLKNLLAYCQQKQWPITVYGPKNESIPHCDVKLIEDDIISVIGIDLSVIDLPGHTAGHIAYFAQANVEPFFEPFIKPILFCGDTLFSGGCGRLFEGSAEQMLQSLTKLANLPESTKVYCAHEYTQANLKFALAVEPKNEILKSYSLKVNDLRSKGQATIPTTIKVEKQINPFLRSHKIAIQTSANQFDCNTLATSLDTFTTTRRWKDQF